MARKQANSILPQGIRLHPSGKFLIDVRINGERFTKTFASLEEAIVNRKKLVSGEITPNELRGVTDSTSPEGVWTLKQAYDCAHRVVWQGMASAVTNEFNGKAALRYFGETRKLSTITLVDIDTYVEHLFAKGDKGSTVNRKLSCLSVILKTAHDRGGFGKHPLPKLPKRVKETEGRIRFLSDAEEYTLLHILDESGYEAQAEAVKVLLYTGFRCGELWKLEKRDVDLKNRVLTLWETKNGTARSVPLVDCIFDIIERRVHEGESVKVFPEGSNAWLRNAWEKARELMDYTEDAQFVPHILRHTCATRLSQRGVPMKVVQGWLGHKSISTTARYAHFNQADLQLAAQSLNSGFNKNSE